MNKYIGTYTIFIENKYNTNNPIIDEITNQSNQFLCGKYKTEIYRYSKDTLAIYLSSNQTINKINEQNIEYTYLCQGDTESIILVKEKYIEELNLALGFKIKGRLEQLKELKRQEKLQKKFEKEKNRKSKSD